MIESVIHDWDGVLNDSMEAVLKTYSIISGKPLEYIRKIYNPDWKRFEKEADIPRRPTNEWVKIFREQSSDVKLFPGAMEYIQKIRNDGYKTAIVTSANSCRIRADLKKYGLTNTFNTIVTAEDVTHLKPNPDCLKIAARRLDSSIPECIFIGDTKEDALAAKGINMSFIGVGWGYHTPIDIKSVNGDKVASDFDELYERVREL